MNLTNKKNISLVTVLLLIASALTSIQSIYSAEKSRQPRPPMPLPQPKTTMLYEPVIMSHSYNNEIWIESEKLPECVHFEFATKILCCGGPYTTSTTIPMGSSDYLFECCKAEKRPDDKSIVSFYNHNFNEQKQTISAREGSIFKISKSTDGTIIITQGKNFRDENHKEVLRFTLKK